MSSADLDEFCQQKVLEVPWLRDSVKPTGKRWGKAIADVKMSRLPQNLLGQTLLIPDVDDEVLVVIFRCDRRDHLGWDEPISVTLTFPDEKVYEFTVPCSYKLIDGHSYRVPIQPGTLLRQRPQQLSRKIPRIIFNLSAPLHKQLSQPVRRLLENIRDMTEMLQCTSLYLVIEDAAGLKEVQNSTIPNFLNAYTAVKSGAYKADLLRYFLLYKYGGVYLDDKTFLRHSLDSDLFDQVLQDGEMVMSFGSAPEIAFICSRQGSPIMLKALEESISNIMKREYTNHRLGITGNLMMKKLLNTDNNPGWRESYGEKLGFIPIEKSDERITINDDIFWERQTISRADWPRPKTHYADLWNQRLVYTDGNPERRSRAGLSVEVKRQIIAYTATIVGVIFFGLIISRYQPET
jgi:hypothetical protein